MTPTEWAQQIAACRQRVAWAKDDIGEAMHALCSRGAENQQAPAAVRDLYHHVVDQFQGLEGLLAAAINTAHQMRDAVEVEQ